MRLTIRVKSSESREFQGLAVPRLKIIIPSVYPGFFDGFNEVELLKEDFLALLLSPQFSLFYQLENQLPAIY